jgi:HNH endonuclease
MYHTIFVLDDKDGKLGLRVNYKFLKPEIQELFKFINTLYEFKPFIWMNNNHKKLRPRIERTCRFCGKSYPEVKFSNKAHIIPELIGNKMAFSDFECDTCNCKFGIYESDFANYLGIFRTIAEITGKKGVPKFTSHKVELRIEQAFKNNIDIKLRELNIENKLLYNEKEGILRIITKGNPYSSINVFRCLLKSAISLVDTEDLKHLSNTIKFLLDDKYCTDPSNDFIFTIHQYFIPGNFNTDPFVIQYKKRINFIGYAAPSLIFIFYIRNIIIQLAIPFHEKDSLLYKPDAERHLFIVPPLIRTQWFIENGGPFSKLVNLNDMKINKENKQVIDWKFTRK